MHRGKERHHHARAILTRGAMDQERERAMVYCGDNTRKMGPDGTGHPGVARPHGITRDS